MLTAEQRAARRTFLGGSDAAAIVGCDPWRNAADVALSKLYDLADEPNEAMTIGNLLEPVCLGQAADRLGSLETSVMFQMVGAPLGANLDGRVIATGDVVEAKYVGIKGADYWGQEGTDEVPEHVKVQVLHQMACSKASQAHVVAAICRPYVGLRFEFFLVPRDEELIEELIDLET